MGCQVQAIRKAMRYPFRRPHPQTFYVRTCTELALTVPRTNYIHFTENCCIQSH